MMDLYGAVSVRLDKIDFPALWPGFARAPFALYDDEMVWLDGTTIPRDDRFLGNTTILLDGAWTAIWNAAGDEDPDELAAQMVHEMFHSFQQSRGEARFPDDLELLRLGIDECELALRALECAILAERRPSLPRLADARARRRAANPALTREAELAETAEGMAELMGMAALFRIAPEKGERLRARHQARLGDAEHLANTRRMAYFSGALLLAAAREAGLSPFHDVGREARTLGEIILSEVPPEDAGDAPDVSEIARMQMRRARERCVVFRDSAARIEGRGRITGYDPMNMTRADNLLLCDRFVMLDGKLIEGPLLLEMAAASKNEAAAIYMRKSVVS